MIFEKVTRGASLGAPLAVGGAHPGFHEAEGGEEEAYEDDEILSDVEGGGLRGGVPHQLPWFLGSSLTMKRLSTMISDLVAMIHQI